MTPRKTHGQSEVAHPPGRESHLESTDEESEGEADTDSSFIVGDDNFD